MYIPSGGGLNLLFDTVLMKLSPSYATKVYTPPPINVYSV